MKITIPFKKMFTKTENGFKGGLHFTLKDTTGKIVDDSGNELGRISGVLGGGIEIQINGEMESAVYANPRDIWDAYCEQMGRNDLKLDER